MRQYVFSDHGNWERAEWAISNLLQSYNQIVQEEQEDPFVQANPIRSKRARTTYNKCFSKYPDIVNIQQFAEMANIGECLARRIAKEGYIQSISHATRGWQFPKRWVVDYLLSDHYRDLMKSLNKNRSGKNE